jgi:hypothetical protein
MVTWEEIDGIQDLTTKTLVKDLVARIQKEGLFDSNFRALINPRKKTKTQDSKDLFHKIWKITRAIGKSVDINGKKWSVARHTKSANQSSCICFKGVNHFHLYRTGNIEFQSNRGVMLSMRYKTMKGMRPMSRVEATTYIKAILMRLV